jgi:hypothetical protein
MNDTAQTSAMKTKTETWAQHFDPGTWDHPRAREMGLRPDVPLTVELIRETTFDGLNVVRQSITEVIKVMGRTVYEMPIVRTASGEED